MVLALVASLIAVTSGPARPDDSRQLPSDAALSTLIKTPLGVEGLTGDDEGNLYTTGRGSTPFCPIWRVNIANPSLVPVGNIPAPCSPSGLAFNEVGDLFVADDDKIWTFTPNAVKPPIATVFASGVPGANGVAFAPDGNLWTGDGTTGQGRVWKIAPCQTPPCAADLVFRVQPMRNGTSLGGHVPGDGVGRQARTFPPGTSANTAGGQDLVANGLALNHEGELFVADTARGAIWKVEFDRQGNLKSPTGCDTTFTPNTLCLDNLFVAHPYLEGTDGIALDRAGNIWNSVNERNAIVVVTKDGRVVEIFRNPANAAGLRSSADPSVGNNHILEFPTSPFLLGDRFCTANSDGGRRDNSPNTAGEITPEGPDRGKISCMDQDLRIPGLPLPIR